MNNQSFPRLFPVILLVLALLNACSGAPSGGTSIWIDVPVDGLTFPSLQPIKIEGHASSPGGIVRVEVWINGVLANTITDLTVEGTLASFHMEWTPPAPSVYNIQTIAFGADGAASQPDSAQVTFGDGGATPSSTPTLIEGCPTPVGGGPTPVSCTTPVVECPTPVGGGPTPVSCPTLIITDTPTLPQSAVVQFWADPAEIEAGACTTIRWHAENVQRISFGGIDQPFDGTYKDCLCSNQRYTLTVVKQDGTEEKYQVDIAVNGECMTPTSPPPQDTTPPAAPTPAVPADGLSIACKASQSLVWVPVEDPSGIAKYHVQVQRQAGDGNWQDAPNGDIAAAGKTTSVPVECGWYYRWRIQAIDGAGNVSEWSGWSQFAITLS